MISDNIKYIWNVIFLSFIIYSHKQIGNILIKFNKNKAWSKMVSGIHLTKKQENIIIKAKNIR